LIGERFVKVLKMAQKLKFLKVGQITVAVEWTSVSVAYNLKRLQRMKMAG
jgi:hypothetical protein